MNQLPIVLDFDEGIDRKTLRQLRDRFLVVNQQRWERAHSAFTYRQQMVLELLPLVFHANHPALPGYLDGDCPFGLRNYQPPESVLTSARRFARTFTLRDDGQRTPDLEALFLMGSPGTLGHSVASDLDVWLCHREDLSGQGVRCLERKAEKLSSWAATLGVELHVFVFSADDWRAGRHRAEVTGENCGSAQHFLLLDEFYRTGIHLGGCYPVWWLIPVDDEARYESCVRQLMENRFIRRDEYIDFGPVTHIPEEEFLGAGVWQLYKGIDAPWKSILKLLLIECYAQAGPRPLLSAVFKRAVHGGEACADNLDPYVLLYRRLEDWLKETDARERLELVRRSLYLKAGLPLSRIAEGQDSWRTRLLQALVSRWGWSEKALAELDNRQSWRAEDVVRLRRTIVGELTHSYRMLSEMARTQGTRCLISAGDINLLGRKLYAAFQRKAGKIELINPGLAPTLAEENLAFHHVSEQGMEASGWLLFRDLEDPSDAFWQTVIRRSGNLAELMVWSYCNGLLTSSTRLNVRAGSSVASVSELRAILDALMEFLPFPIPSAGRQALSMGVRPLRNLLLVNVAADPQSSLTEKGLHKISARHDSLGFSGGRENLVVTIDQVSLNSWCEVSVQHYAAGDVLIQCLKNILAAAASCPASIPEVQVHCHNRGHGASISRRIRELFQDVFRQFFAGGTGPHPVRFVIEMDRRYFLLQFSGAEPGFVGLDSHKALLEQLAQPQEEYVPVVLDRYAVLDDPALRAVCQASEPDSIQVFFLDQGLRVQIWVIDERGSLATWDQPASGRKPVLTPLLRFLDNVTERRSLRRSEAATVLAGVRCWELVRRDGDWCPEYRPNPETGAPVPGFEIQAIGVQGGDGQLAFDLYCDDQEFSVQEYGGQRIPALVHYLRSRYPEQVTRRIWVTDLHLPHDLNPQAYRQDIQTSQYLHYRCALEEALNRELHAGRE